MAIGGDGRVEGLAIAVALKRDLANGSILSLLLLCFLEECNELVEYLEFGFGVGHKQSQVLLDYFIDIVASIKFAQHFVGHCN